MKKFSAGFAALAGAGLATQANAQTPQIMIAAHDPGSVVAALAMDGYETELTTDDSGDPKITIELVGMLTHVYFFGCEDNANCDSLMFMTGFDRETPWTIEDATGVNKEVRFASTWLDEEGDPWISWDVVTGEEGIPASVFSLAVARYSDTVDIVADMVFAEERGE